MGEKKRDGGGVSATNHLFRGLKEKGKKILRREEKSPAR